MRNTLIIYSTNKREQVLNRLQSWPRNSITLDHILLRDSVDSMLGAQSANSGYSSSGTAMFHEVRENDDVEACLASTFQTECDASRSCRGMTFEFSCLASPVPWMTPYSQVCAPPLASILLRSRWRWTDCYSRAYIHDRDTFAKPSPVCPGPLLLSLLPALLAA